MMMEREPLLCIEIKSNCACGIYQGSVKKVELAFPVESLAAQHRLAIGCVDFHDLNLPGL